MKKDWSRLIEFRIAVKKREIGASKKYWLKEKNQTVRKIPPNWKEEFFEIGRLEQH